MLGAAMGEFFLALGSLVYIVKNVYISRQLHLKITTGNSFHIKCLLFRWRICCALKLKVIMACINSHSVTTCVIARMIKCVTTRKVLLVILISRFLDRWWTQCIMSRIFIMAKNCCDSSGFSPFLAALHKFCLSFVGFRLPVYCIHMVHLKS